MELGHGRIYKIIGRRFTGSDPAPEQETFDGWVYQGRTEWSTEGQPMDAFWCAGRRSLPALQSRNLLNREEVPVTSHLSRDNGVS